MSTIRQEPITVIIVIMIMIVIIIVVIINQIHKLIKQLEFVVYKTRQ